MCGDAATVSHTHTHTHTAVRWPRNKQFAYTPAAPTLHYLTGPAVERERGGESDYGVLK